MKREHLIGHWPQTQPTAGTQLGKDRWILRIFLYPHGERLYLPEEIHGYGS